eukprot:435825-Hanusia_phi.AAC.1
MRMRMRMDMMMDMRIRRRMFMIEMRMRMRRMMMMGTMMMGTMMMSLPLFLPIGTKRLTSSSALPSLPLSYHAAMSPKAMSSPHRRIHVA